MDILNFRSQYDILLCVFESVVQTNYASKNNRTLNSKQINKELIVMRTRY